MRSPQRAHTLFKAKWRRPPQSAPHGARQRVATQPRRRTRGRGAKIRRAGLGAGRAPAASTRPAEGAACSATGLPLVREVFRRGAGSAPHPPSPPTTPPRRRRTCCSPSTCLPAPSSRAVPGGEARRRPAAASPRRQATRTTPRPTAQPPPAGPPPRLH